MLSPERQPRMLRRLVVRYSTGEGALPRSGCTMDLSRSGLFLNARAILPPGTHVLGRVELPDGRRAEVHGVVVWSRPTPKAINDRARGGMGLRLVWAERAYFEFLSRTAVTAQAA